MSFDDRARFFTQGAERTAVLLQAQLPASEVLGLCGPVLALLGNLERLDLFVRALALDIIPEDQVYDTLNCSSGLSLPEGIWWLGEKSGRLSRMLMATRFCLSSYRSQCVRSMLRWNGSCLNPLSGGRSGGARRAAPAGAQHQRDHAYRRFAGLRRSVAQLSHLQKPPVDALETAAEVSALIGLSERYRQAAALEEREERDLLLLVVWIAEAMIQRGRKISWH